MASCIVTIAEMREHPALGTACLNLMKYLADTRTDQNLSRTNAKRVVKEMVRSAELQQKRSRRAAGISPRTRSPNRRPQLRHSIAP